MKLFSKRIQHLMDVKKNTQKDIVDRVGFDKAQVSNWVSGTVKTPRRATLQKLSDFFQCNIDWLAEGVGQPFPDSNQETISPKAAIAGDQREADQLDEAILKEIQAWLNDKEKQKPGYKSWFRVEFDERFPEFERWKGLIPKNSSTGTDD